MDLRTGSDGPRVLSEKASLFIAAARSSRDFQRIAAHAHALESLPSRGTQRTRHDLLSIAEVIPPLQHAFPKRPNGGTINSACEINAYSSYGSMTTLIDCETACGIRVGDVMVRRPQGSTSSLPGGCRAPRTPTLLDVNYEHPLAVVRKSHVHDARKLRRAERAHGSKPK